MPDGEMVYKGELYEKSLHDLAFEKKCCTTFFAGEKELKPVSGRVKEIAEFLLSCVMEKIVSAYASTLRVRRKRLKP